MIKLFLFGPPRLEDEGEPLQLRHRKAWALLAYLTMTGQLHSRDTLAALLWPDQPQTKARANLRRELTRLRNLLGKDQFVADRETISLNKAVGLWVDVTHFQAQLALARRCPHPETAGPEAEACANCLPYLKAAVDTYSADFLAGFSAPDSLDFEEWQLFQAEGLRQDLSSALARLVEGYRHTAHFDQAISQAHRWLALDSLNEVAHQHLMALYDQTGQHAAALRQYELCAGILAEELDAAPQPETIALYEQIRARDGLVESVSTDSSWRETLRATQAPQHNLPPALTPFIGRAADLAELKARLQDPNCRLLTLVGPGGSGKTRLAQEVAATQIGHYPHGVFFVPLASIQSVETIVPAVAEALEFSFHGGGEPQQQLLTYLRQKRMLLILDNFEHLLAGVDIVTGILATASEVKILTTSRANLNVQSEHLFPVTGLDFPADEAQQVTAAYSAINLFVSSANRIQPALDMKADLADVAQICRLVQGMPLAVLLAAAWAELLTPAEIVSEIEHSLDFLAADWADLPDRQRSMRAVFDHSWRLLTGREQAVFRAVSVFRGGFTREAVQVVADASLEALMRLSNKSLLHRLPGDRYEVHELLRQYVAEKLAESGPEEAKIQQKHSHYYFEFLIQRQEALAKDKPDRAVLVAIDQEIENIRVAWQWVRTRGDMKMIEGFVTCLWFFYKHKTWYQEAISVLNQACSLEAVPLRLGAHWHSLLGEAHWNLGQLASARRHTLQTLQMLGQPLAGSPVRFMGQLVKQLIRQALRPLGFQPPFPPKKGAQANQTDQIKIARTYFMATRLSFMANDNVPAISYALYGLNLAERGGTSDELALAYIYWSNACDGLSWYKWGQYYASQAEIIARQMGTPSVLLEVFFILGLHYLLIAQLSAAHDALAQGADLARDLEDWQGWGEIASFFVILHFWRGEFAQIAAYCDELYLLSQRYDDHSLATISLNWQGRQALLLNQPDQAIQILAKSNRVTPGEAKTQLWELLNQGWFALGCLRRGQLAEAEQIAAKALPAVKASWVPSFVLIECATAVAQVYLTLWERAGDEGATSDPNLPSLARLKSQARQAGRLLWWLAWLYPAGQAPALLYRGWYHWLSGRPRQAHHLWAKGLTCAQEAGMPYYLGLIHYEIGRHLPLQQNEPHQKREAHLSRAHEIFSQLAATYELACVEQVRGRHSGVGAARPFRRE